MASTEYPDLVSHDFLRFCPSIAGELDSLDELLSGEGYPTGISGRGAPFDFETVLTITEEEVLCNPFPLTWGRGIDVAGGAGAIDVPSADINQAQFAKAYI